MFFEVNERGYLSVECLSKVNVAQEFSKRSKFGVFLEKKMSVFETVLAGFQSR